MLDSIPSIDLSESVIGRFQGLLLLVALEGLQGYSLQQVMLVCLFFGAVRRYIFTFRLVGGTESLGITAGETKNPSKNMPRVVKLVFWR